MSEEMEIDMGPEDERERGDETPPSPPIGSPEWWARMKACEDELKAMIREANDIRRKEKIRLW